MNPLDLSPQHATDWLRLLFGAALFLAPGVAAAQHFLPRSPLRLLLAPVFSFSLLVLTGIVLDVVFGAPVNAPVTAAIAIGWTLVFARQWRTWAKAVPMSGKAWLPVLFIIPLVALVQALPHLPGEDGTALDAYPRLAERAVDGLAGNDWPYPVHVDEYIRMAQMSDMVEEGTMVIGDPYTGGPPPDELFSVGGLRAERGFALAMAQLHLLTGASFPFIARLLPALWAGWTGAIVYAALRPAPGAALAGGASLVMPNSARFLGSGFLVPSNFALAWIFAAILVVREAPAERRLGLQWMLVTAAFSLHLVQGTLTLVALLLMHAFSGQRETRWASMAAAALPLVWILPPMWYDAVGAVSGQTDLPFDVHVLLAPGIPFFILAAAGATVAFQGRDPDLIPHRALTVLGLILGTSMVWSVVSGHTNDATYTRIYFMFILCVGALGGLALGSLAKYVKKWMPAAAGTSVAVVLALALVAPGIDANLDMPHYRIHNEASWAAHQAFTEAGVPDGAVFLTEPWQAPTSTLGNGAIPWTVLYPGNLPTHDGDYAAYALDGADPAWLSQRGIEYIISPMPPNATHEQVAPLVWRILPG